MDRFEAFEALDYIQQKANIPSDVYIFQNQLFRNEQPCALTEQELDYYICIRKLRDLLLKEGIK